MDKKISIFASSVRQLLYPDFFKYLKSSEIETVFSGNIDSFTNDYTYMSNWNIRYIKTGDIKPAQNYEIARRYCQGEVIVWGADDMEFINNILPQAYTYWKSKNNEKLILSLQTKESGYGAKDGKIFDMNEHRFFSWIPESPLMAPVCMMSRKFLDNLGGIDQRYVCGQYENDIVMRAYQYGATVEVFGNKDLYVDIDHLKKSIQVGESTNQEDFLNRPFASGYQKDREVLENSWTTFDNDKMFKRLQAGERPLTMREISPVQLDDFIPYPSVIPLDKSLSNKGRWE